MPSPSMPVAALAAAVCCVSSLAAQTLLGQIQGTVPQGQFGTVVRALGDLDGDGVRDFAVSEPGNSSNTAGRLLVHSGRTRALLRTMQGALAAPYTWGLGTRDICPLGDVNGDGTPDVAAGYVNRGVLDVFSGATGARLYRMGPTLEYLQYACNVGDRDGDGRADLAAFVYVNSSTQLWSIKGNTGTQLAVIEAQAQEGPLYDAGDLNGDGSTEFVVVSSGLADVYRMNPPGRLRRITLPFSTPRASALADWNGDGRLDLVVQYDVNQQQPAVYVYNLATGAQLRSYTLSGSFANSTPYGMAVLGDLDLDGTPDLALQVAGADPIFPGNAHIAFLSGASGARLGAWPGTAQFGTSSALAGLGDVDADGFPDFAMGQAGFQAQTGAVQLISGRTVAAAAEKPVNCATGPFPPRLGMSRPVLGTVCTIAGRDAPVGAPGFVVLGPLPASATNLGVPGCEAWFGIGTAALLAQPVAAPDWSLPVPLPNVRQLVGLELALQAYYVGTPAPLGYDLSNGVWARLGY